MRIERTSRLEAGSSSTSTRGPWADTLAHAIFCLSPPESLNRLRSSSPRSPKRSTASSTAASMRSASQPMFSQQNASSLVLSTLKNWLRGFWNTLPTSAAVRAMGSSLGSSAAHAAPPTPAAAPSPAAARPPDARAPAPSVGPTRTSPHRSPSKNWGTRPFTRRVSVVLPQPDRPHRTTTCPAGTSTHTSSSAYEPSCAPLCRNDTCRTLTGAPPRASGEPPPALRTAAAPRDAADAASAPSGPASGAPPRASGAQPPFPTIPEPPSSW